jgi:hypothetical protein
LILWTIDVCDQAPQRDSPMRATGWGETSMDERDWKEEQRRLLARLLDSAFKRREAPENVGTVNRQPDDPQLIAQTVTSPDPLTKR